MNIKIQKNNGYRLEKTYICLNDNSYLIKNNNDVIGFFNAIKWNNSIIVDYELIGKYRNRGLGKELFKYVEEYIYINFEFDKFLAFIKEENKAAQKLVDGYNYSRNFDFNNEEMPNFNAYYKTNEKTDKKLLN